MRVEDHGQIAEVGSPLWEQRRQQLIDERDAEIAERGYTWGGVFNDRFQWIFTIGLLPDHPELILTGARADVLGAIGERVAQRVLDGERFGHSDEIDLSPDDEPYRVRAVAFDREPTGGEHGWFNQHPLAGVEPEMFSAVQVVWPAVHVADQDEPDAELLYPTVDDPWNDQPILGEVWWS